MTVNGQRIGVASGPDHDIADATLYLRPEELKFEPLGGAANVIQGRIESLVYGGSTIDYRVSTVIGELEISRFADQDQYAVGDTAHMFWSPSSGTILPREAR